MDEKPQGEISGATAQIGDNAASAYVQGVKNGRWPLSLVALAFHDIQAIERLNALQECISNDYHQNQGDQEKNDSNWNYSLSILLWGWHKF